MREYLDDAKEELKRADHLIYVSLKYTRTVDIIKHTIERLILAFDHVFLGFLEKAKKEGKILEIVNAPAKKCEDILKLYPGEDEITKSIAFYLLLRKLDRAKFERISEFRRHVAMISEIGGEKYSIDIDKINEYYDSTKKFVSYVEENHLIK